MRRRVVRLVTCLQCHNWFSSSVRTARFCSHRCVAQYFASRDPAARAEQLRKARACRAPTQPKRPKPDLSVFAVPVFIPAPAVEEPAELPPVPGIDHAQLVMLRWAGARV